jgi:hypothetical protein
VAVEFDSEMGSGPVLAAVDWAAAVAALDAGRLPCSSSEAQMLRLAASIAGGVAVDLGAALSGLDEGNISLVAAAVLRAAGRRDLGVPVVWRGGR